MEEELTQLRITGRGQDLIRYPVRIAGRLVFLSNDMRIGLRTHGLAPRRLRGLKSARRHEGEVRRIHSGPLAAFNTR